MEPLVEQNLAQKTFIIGPKSSVKMTIFCADIFSEKADVLGNLICFCFI